MQERSIHPGLLTAQEPHLSWETLLLKMAGSCRNIRKCFPELRLFPSHALLDYADLCSGGYGHFGGLLCYSLPPTFGLQGQKAAPCCVLPPLPPSPNMPCLICGIRSMQSCCMTLCMAHLSSGKKVQGVCSDNTARKLSQREGSFY